MQLQRLVQHYTYNSESVHYFSNMGNKLHQIHKLRDTSIFICIKSQYNPPQMNIVFTSDNIFFFLPQKPHNYQFIPWNIFVRWHQAILFGLFSNYCAKHSVWYLQALFVKIYNSRDCIFISNTTQKEEDASLKHSPTYCLPAASVTDQLIGNIQKHTELLVTFKTMYNFALNKLDHWSECNILLLKLSQTLGFNKYIQSICSKAQ